MGTRSDDRNPPDWAGGDNTGYVLWEFTEDVGAEGGDQPTSYSYNPELTDPVFGFRYYESGSEFTWNSGGGLNGDGSINVVGEESVVMLLPEGTGANLTIQVQITHIRRAKRAYPV